MGIWRCRRDGFVGYAAGEYVGGDRGLCQDGGDSHARDKGNGHP
jgi:hypothetical protein